MYSFHLFLISSASTRSLPFLCFIVPIFGWISPLMFPIFLMRFLVFPLLLFSSIIKHCWLKKPFLSLLAILWSCMFSWVHLSLSSLLFTSLHVSTICEASSDNHFAFLLFFFFGMVLFATSYSLVAQRLTRLPPMRETWVQSLGQEDPLENEMVTHSSILAWRIP